MKDEISRHKSPAPDQDCNEVDDYRLSLFSPFTSIPSKRAYDYA